MSLHCTMHSCMVAVQGFTLGTLQDAEDDTHREQEEKQKSNITCLARQVACLYSVSVNDDDDDDDDRWCLWCER